MDRLLDQITDGALTFDDHGRVQFVNAALRRVIGSNGSEIPADFLSPPVTLALRDAASRCRAQGGVATAVAFRLERGTPQQFTGRALPTDQASRFVCIFSDPSTDRNLAASFEAILAAIPDLLLVLDRNARYRRIFTANHDLLVGSPEFLLGKTVDEVMPAEEASFGSKIICHVIETGQSCEVVHRLTIGGQPRWFLVRVAPFIDRGEDCVLWLSRDVTETTLAKLRRTASHGLLQELLHIQDRERFLLASELHDGFVQEIVGARMWLESVSEERQGATQPATDALAIARESLDRAIVHAREIINSLRPVLTDHSGIEAGLQALVEQANRRCDTTIAFQSSGNLGPLLPMLETAMIRISQEALKNVVCHSQARNAVLRISREDERVQLVIEDDGVGFDIQQLKEESFGVDSIIRRAKVFGGTATVDSSINQGSRIMVTLPCIPLRDDSRIANEEFSAMMLERAESQVSAAELEETLDAPLETTVDKTNLEAADE